MVAKKRVGPGLLGVFGGTLAATLLISVGCATTIDLGYGNEVRKERASEVAELLRQSERDPVLACNDVLPTAIHSGRFSDSWLFGYYSELTLLTRAETAACECKRRLFATNGVPAFRLDQVPSLSLAQLMAVAMSVNQSSAVNRAVVKALQKRVSTATLEEIATIYVGGAGAVLHESEPPLIVGETEVACNLSLQHPERIINVRAVPNPNLAKAMTALAERRQVIRNEADEKERARLHKEKEAAEAARRADPNTWVPIVMSGGVDLGLAVDFAQRNRATASATDFERAYVAEEGLCVLLNDMAASLTKADIFRVFDLVQQRYALVAGMREAGALRALLESYRNRPAEHCPMLRQSGWGPRTIR